MRPTFAGGFFRDERVRAPTPWSATGAVGGPASGIFLGSAPPAVRDVLQHLLLVARRGMLLADERLRVEGAMVVSAEDAPTLPARIARCPRTRRPRCRALGAFLPRRRAPSPSRRGLPRVDARAVCFEKTGDVSTLNSRGARKPSARARSKRRRRAGRLGTSDRALFTVRDPRFPDPRSTGASERLTPTKPFHRSRSRSASSLSPNLVAADDDERCPRTLRPPRASIPSVDRAARGVRFLVIARARAVHVARAASERGVARDGAPASTRGTPPPREAPRRPTRRRVFLATSRRPAPRPPPPGAPLARDARPRVPGARSRRRPRTRSPRSPRRGASGRVLARTLARYVPARSTGAPSRGVVDDRASRQPPSAPSDARLASGSLAARVLRRVPRLVRAPLAEALLDAAERKRRRERRRKRGRVAAEESTLPGRSSSGMRKPRGASRQRRPPRRPPSNAFRPSPRASSATPPRSRSSRARPRFASTADSSPRRRIRIASRRKPATPTSFRPLPPPSAIVGYQDEWLEAPIDRVAIARGTLARRAVRAEGAGGSPSRRPRRAGGGGGGGGGGGERGGPGRARSLAAQTLAEIAAQYELCGLGACEPFARVNIRFEFRFEPVVVGCLRPAAAAPRGRGDVRGGAREVRDAAAALDRPSAVVAFVAVAERRRRRRMAPGRFRGDANPLTTPPVGGGRDRTHRSNTREAR